MTPEERLTRIENAIQALVETQSRHESELEKQNAGIRDLIVVSRTLIDAQQSADKTIGQLTGAQQSADKKINQLIDAQQSTDQKLNQLIVTVDRLANTVDQGLKSFQKPNGNQQQLNQPPNSFRHLTLQVASDEEECEQPV